MLEVKKKKKKKISLVLPSKIFKWAHMIWVCSVVGWQRMKEVGLEGHPQQALTGPSLGRPKISQQ